MDNTSIVLFGSKEGERQLTRDIFAIGFRHRRLFAISFVLLMIGIGTSLFFTRKYESQLDLLVKRERMDPVVTPQDDATFRYQTTPVVSEEELNSEAEIITSSDLLRSLIIQTGMDKESGARLSLHIFPSSEEERIASMQRVLAKAIKIGIPKKNNIIVVTYRNRDPRKAAQVLKTLSTLYLAKHAEVHRSAGQYEFFQREAEHFHQQLTDVEKQLAEFPKKDGVVSGALERDLTVQKIADLNITLQVTAAAILENKKRIAALEAQIAKSSARMTTVIKQSDNPPLMEKLKGTLLDLELQRTELLQKYQPTHRKVQEVEEKIAEARVAIQASLNAPMTEQTTDRDPTFEWMRSELAKARTDVSSLEARAAATSHSIDELQKQAQNFNERSIEQQALLRTEKDLETNYQLYLHKQEESRITDAMDRNKILNVAIVDEPAIPMFPSPSLRFILLAAIAGASVLSTGLVFIIEYLDPTFRNTYEVQRYLGVPVLAALPEQMGLPATASTCIEGNNSL